MKKICLLLFAAVALTAALATALYFSNDGQEPARAQPVGENLAAADFLFNWGPPDWLDITGRIHTSPSINLIAQAPGSSAEDFSPQQLPVLSPPHASSAVDLGAEEFNPPFTP